MIARSALILAVSTLAVSTLALAACNKPDASPEPADGTAPAQTVKRVDPADAAPPVQPAIQTQPGPSGSQVDLTRVKVTGDVLTVQLSYRATTDFNDYFPIDQVSVVDDATAQKYGVLKSADGAQMASPLFQDDKINVVVSEGDSRVVWFKFPAPPATSPTVSINIPNVGPFDGVPVSR